MPGAAWRGAPRGRRRPRRRRAVASPPHISSHMVRQLLLGLVVWCGMPTLRWAVVCCDSSSVGSLPVLSLIPSAPPQWFPTMCSFPPTSLGRPTAHPRGQRKETKKTKPPATQSKEKGTRLAREREDAQLEVDRRRRRDVPLDEPRLRLDDERTIVARGRDSSWRRERANLFTRRVRCETRPWRRSSRATAARVLSRATVPRRGEGRRSLRAAPPLRCDLPKYLGEVVSREAQHALLLPVRGERAEVVPGSSRAARWWHVRNAEWCGRPSSPRWSSTARRW